MSKEISRLFPTADIIKTEQLRIKGNSQCKYLSNIVPKAEERKEARNAERGRIEEQERIEEEERKCRARGERPSFRARLAEKKAIVAVNSAVPKSETQRQVQYEAVASQRDI